MNINKFKHQHVEILGGIAALRTLSQAGITQNAQAIAARIVALSSVVRLHLSVEDRVLYPQIEALGDANLRQMSRAYQTEMAGIASSYMDFASRWNTAARVLAEPEAFRQDANVVLKRVFDRMQRENREFYPAVEEASDVAA